MAVNSIRFSNSLPSTIDARPARARSARPRGHVRTARLVGAAVAVLLLGWSGGTEAQDARRGEHVFRKCLLCHVLDPKATNLIAPPLHNLIGRRAATVPGFSYSDIMLLAREKGLIWNADALYYFLDRPEDFMPGTYMAFAGLEEQERKDVIAYLTKITDAYNAQQQAPAVPFGAPKSMAPIKVEPKGPANNKARSPSANSKP